MAAAEKAAELAPTCFSYHIGLAEFQLATGDVKGAASRLKSAAETYSTAYQDPGNERAVVKMARTLQRIGELDAAWKLVEKVGADNRSAQRLRYTIKSLQGDLDGARREAIASFRLIKSPMAHLSLNDLLNECLKQAQADNQEPEIAKWLWPRLGLPESRRADWLLHLRWGLLVNDTVSEWIMVNRERLHELDDIIEPRGWSLYEAARKEGKPVVLAGAHLGPSLVVLHYLSRLAHPMMVVTARRDFAIAIGSKPFLPEVAPHNIIGLRDALIQFGTVFLAGDAKGGRSRYPAEFLGSKVLLREGVPALARLGGALTFFVAATWVNRRIKIELVPGPSPLKSENRGSWNERWFSFYLSQLERHLRAAPENVRAKTISILTRQ